MDGGDSDCQGQKGKNQIGSRTAGKTQARRKRKERPLEEQEYMEEESKRRSTNICKFVPALPLATVRIRLATNSGWPQPSLPSKKHNVQQGSILHNMYRFYSL